MKYFITLITVVQLVFALPADFSLEKDSRVVGGRDAREHEAPYIVSLQVDFLNDGNFRHICGGSILNRNWILSAAHCITEVGLQFNYQIVAGQHNLAVDSGNEQRIFVEKFIPHENFVSGPVVGPFDIILLRLVSPLLLEQGIVETIELPSLRTTPSGESTLFGWGSTSSTNTPSLPNILQTVTKPILEFEICREIVNTVMDHEPLNFYSNICTGSLNDNRAACNGDSGGPLVQHEGDHTELIGIASWISHFPCGSINSVSVYTRTSEFIQWIDENMLPL